MSTGIRINNAKNFFGENYATQPWVTGELDAFLKSFEALTSNKVVFTKGDGTTVELDLSTLVQNGNGISVTNNEVHINLDETGENYLTVGKDGLKLSGIDAAIKTSDDAIWTYVGKDDTTGLSLRIKNAEDSIATIVSESIDVSGENAIVATGTTSKVISLKLDGTDKILSQGTDGLKATVQLKSITTGLGENISKKYVLVGSDGTTELGDVIEIEKDRFLQSATYDSETHKITFSFNLADGSTSSTEVDLSDLVDVYTASKGITKVGSDFQGVVDPNSESFLSVGTDGFKVAGVQNAINAAVSTSGVKLKTAVEKAVELVATTISIPSGTTGEFTSSEIPGRVMHVSDASGVIYPDIVYSSNTINCTTTLKADFGSTATTEDETWFVVYAKPIQVAE